MTSRRQVFLGFILGVLVLLLLLINYVAVVGVCIGCLLGLGIIRIAECL